VVLETDDVVQDPPKRFRWLKWLIILLLIPPFIYVVLGNIFLNVGAIPKLINMSAPGHFSMKFKYAWTILPGKAHVQGIAMEGRSLTSSGCSTSSTRTCR
jgi:hypothetical protein